MWFSIFIGGILAYYLYKLQKRIQSLERTRNGEFSDNFSVSAWDAIIKNKKFGELAGIKSIAEGKDFKNWSKSDKDKWNKEWLSNPNKKLNSVSFNYLASENAYFINDGITCGIKQRGNDLLYKNIIVGDEKYLLEPHLDLEIFERLDKGIWKLTICLKYNSKDFQHKEKDEFNILCEFPMPHLGSRFTDEQLKNLGFEIESHGPDTMMEPWYSDSFGKTKYYSTFTTYEKNGAEISYRSLL